MLFRSSDILKMKPIEVLKQQFDDSLFIIKCVTEITNIKLNEKDIQIKNGGIIKIKTTSARKMVIILNKLEIQNLLNKKNFNLQL